MIHIDVLPLGSYQTNCYFIRQNDSSDCCIIDPGFEPGRISTFLKEHYLTPVAILLTHGHFDHVGAVKPLVADYDCDVYICQEEFALPPMLTNGSLYYTNTYGEGDQISLAGLDLKVIQTPGHTPGSVCLLCEDVMFAGDTLFAQSCGRTDLPGGSDRQMRDSLKRLAALDGNYHVYPGHGPATTLDYERQFNLYL